MSHWKSGKLELKCSLSVLYRALINVMPQWEEYIKTEESGALSIYNTYTHETKDGYSLVVPGGRNPMGGTMPGVKSTPGVSWADIGIQKGADGTWDIDVDPDGLPREIRDIGGILEKEVGRMKVHALAKQRGYQIVAEEQEEDQTYIDMIVPVEDQYRLQG